MWPPIGSLTSEKKTKQRGGRKAKRQSTYGTSIRSDSSPCYLPACRVRRLNNNTSLTLVQYHTVIPNQHCFMIFVAMLSLVCKKIEKPRAFLCQPWLIGRYITQNRHSHTARETKRGLVWLVNYWDKARIIQFGMSENSQGARSDLSVNNPKLHPLGSYCARCK